jgi:membrane fusion protein, multidrug efflux system
MRFKRHFPWRIGGVVAALVAGATLLWPLQASVAQGQPSGAKPRSAAPVPVRVASAVVQDQPLALNAVGQVQAFRQAVVQARIEGVLTEVRFREGQSVRQGELLARLDDRSLQAQVAQAQAELQRLQAQLALARQELQRADNLLSAAAVSAQQRDQQQSQVLQLQAQIQAQQASLGQVRTQLSYTLITAPFAGRVGLRQVDVGNVVRPNDEKGIATLMQVDPLTVVFAVPQARLADVRQALSQPAGALVTVAEKEGGPPLATGRLSAADNMVDAASGSLKLKAELVPSQARLWPGQFVTVRLQTGVLRQALTVPGKAVQRGLDGAFVWRVQGGQAQMVPVRVQWQSDRLVAIDAQAGGLQAGDQVVIDGQSRLKPQARVQVLAG